MDRPALSPVIEPVVNEPAPPRGRSRTCLVSCELPGPDHERLAGDLIAAGGEVSFLYLGADRSRVHRRALEARGVAFAVPEPADVPLLGPSSLALSYRAYQWLRGRTFDALHFDDWFAPGYCVLTARRQGLAFQNMTLSVTLRGPSAWRRQAGGHLLDHPDRLETEAMERRCFELADAVRSPDPALLNWIERRDGPRLAGSSEGASPRTPLVSVCLIHFNRPALLRQALASLKRQDYPSFEVVLVDDGSTDPDARALLDELGVGFAGRGWSIVRQENRYLGAARNAAARRARGEYLLFMDDDNFARPGELSTLVRVADRTRADVVSSYLDAFAGTDPPTEGGRPLWRQLFTGLNTFAALARNCFGDANSLFRRDTYDRLGGFTEDRGSTHEDWELLARAVLAGCRIEAVPEPLAWYRVSPDSMIRTAPRAASFERCLRPYLEDVPADCHDVYRLAQGLAVRVLELEEKVRRRRYRVADAVCAAFEKVPFLKSFIATIVRAARRCMRKV